MFFTIWFQKEESKLLNFQYKLMLFKIYIKILFST